MDENFVKNVYYLGPQGSNAHRAMMKFIQVLNINYENLLAEKTIKSVLESHKKDKTSIAVLPIENSIEGIVRETIDNLMKLEETQIEAEISLPINHLLLAKGKDRTKIKKIISHPQALAQCSKYLYKNFPDVELKEFSSTSYAAQKVETENNETLAAIANETCAQIFHLNILDRNLNDEKDNQTRFYLLGRNSLETKNKKKTALILSVKNKSGALCDVLKIFSNYNINLTYIDSRPSKKRLGEYLFFLEMEGAEKEAKIQTALEELRQYVVFFRVLGSFTPIK